jgi:ribulose-phosphate 3-epimerase
MRMEMNPEMVIAVDGGVTEENCADVVAAGADALIAGTAFFRAADPAKAARKLKGLE